MGAQPSSSGGCVRLQAALCQGLSGGSAFPKGWMAISRTTAGSVGGNGGVFLNREILGAFQITSERKEAAYDRSTIPHRKA